jgi:hypothetical protein
MYHGTELSAAVSKPKRLCAPPFSIAAICLAERLSLIRHSDTRAAAMEPICLVTLRGFVGEEAIAAASVDSNLGLLKPAEDSNLGLLKPAEPRRSTEPRWS